MEVVGRCKGNPVVEEAEEEDEDRGRGGGSHER